MATDSYFNSREAEDEALDLMKQFKESTGDWAAKQMMATAATAWGLIAVVREMRIAQRD